jgi:hypothetical protein
LLRLLLTCRRDLFRSRPELQSEVVVLRISSPSCAVESLIGAVAVVRSCLVPLLISAVSLHSERDRHRQAGDSRFLAQG